MTTICLPPRDTSPHQDSTDKKETPLTSVHVNNRRPQAPDFLGVIATHAPAAGVEN